MGERKLYLSSAIGFIVLLANIDDSLTSATLDPNYSYCFAYTWIGTDVLNKSSSEDAYGCTDYIGNNTVTNTPCMDPIIFPDDLFSIPNPDDLWKKDKASVVCRRSSTQSCVKYTVSFNGLIQYQTHLCTRVRTQTKLINSGCMTEKRDGKKIEVCVCETGKGARKPCNAASSFSVVPGVLFLINLLIWHLF